MLRAETHVVVLRSHLLLHGFVGKGNHFHRDVTYDMVLQTDLDPYTCRRGVRSLNVQMSQKQGGWGSRNFQESSRFCRTTWWPDLQAPADLLSGRREQSSASEIIPAAGYQKNHFIPWFTLGTKASAALCRHLTLLEEGLQKASPAGIEGAFSGTCVTVNSF